MSRGWGGTILSYWTKPYYWGKQEMERYRSRGREIFGQIDRMDRMDRKRDIKGENRGEREGERDRQSDRES